MVNLKVAKSLTLRVLSASTGTQCPFVCKALHFSSLLELYMLHCCVVVPFVLRHSCSDTAEGAYFYIGLYF